MPGANTVHLGDQVIQDFCLLHLLGPIFLATYLMAAASLLHLPASSSDTSRPRPPSPLLCQTDNQARHDVSKHHMCLERVVAPCLPPVLILCAYLSEFLLGQDFLQHIIAAPPGRQDHTVVCLIVPHPGRQDHTVLCLIVSHSERQGHTVVCLNTASHVHLVCVARWRSDCRCSNRLSICSMNLSSLLHTISTHNIDSMLTAKTRPHTGSYSGMYAVGDICADSCNTSPYRDLLRNVCRGRHVC